MPVSPTGLNAFPRKTTDAWNEAECKEKGPLLFLLFLPDGNANILYLSAGVGTSHRKGINYFSSTGSIAGRIIKTRIQKRGTIYFA